MTRVLRLLLVPVALAALLGAPAAAQTDPCVNPDTGALLLTEQQTYIHQAETKAGNLGSTGATKFPSWNTTAPAQSVQQGAGGGYLGNFASYLDPTQAEKVGLTLDGTFSGCLDAMLVELYAAMPTNKTGTSGSLEESAFTGVVNLTVDGQPLIAGGEIEMNTVPNPLGAATYRLRLVVTDLYAAMQSVGIDPAANHQLRLNVAPRYANTDNALFVYDTTEVPAGIKFNGTPDTTYPVLQAG